MITIASDILSRDVVLSKSGARAFFRIRKWVVEYTPRKIAKNHLLSELGRGVERSHLLDSDYCQSNAYIQISCGPTCAKTPKGKLVVSVYGHPPVKFSMLELFREIDAEKKQPKLFNL